ncbi:helix-turn-helix domain-containing protein [Cohnella fermenti]|uniref:AraC family transcriptional regulator n=1 Tax=Cohnella fermenti TaxID=2565925 RepID=A0A4S4BFN0_9BACL|nr:helix-turn-helix domain-containing protein [Cohnella fermenti]THF72908.1 AraC family transcriptional regulator [Cohnella fermenti]
MSGAVRKKNRIFQRLLVFNLIAVLIISIFPQVVFYQYFTNIYNEEVESLNRQVVRQFQDAIDEPIVKAIVTFPNIYLSEIESNEALVYPLNHDISRDSSAILKVARRIADIQDNTSYIHSIDVYYRAGNLLFIGDRVCMLNESSCDLGGSADWFPSYRQSDRIIEWIPARPAGSYDPSPIVTYVRSIPFFGDKESRQGIVAVNVDVTELNKQLLGLKPTLEGGLLIVDKEGRVVAHNYGDQPLPAFLSEPSDLTNEEGTGRFNTKIEGHESVVSFVASEYNDWRYVSIASVESVYRKTNQLRSWMLAVGGAFLAVNGLISVLLTSRAHKPISSRMQTLQTSLARHMPIVRHNFIRGLLFGLPQASGQGMDPESILGIPHEGRWTASFVMRTGPRPDLEPQEAMASDFHLIESLEAEDGEADIRAIRNEQSQILGFVSMTEELAPSAIGELLQRRIGLGGERCLICIGGCYPAADSAIARSFAEADEALEYAFFYPDTSILIHGDMRIGEAKEPAGMPKALDELPAAIRAGDRKRVQQLLDELLETIRCGSYTIRYCRNVMLDLALTFERTMQQMGFQAAEVFGEDLREKYHGLKNANAFEAWIRSVAEAAVTGVSERKQHFDQEFADRIVTFVNQNISHQLSLAYVAEHVGVSPTYLSKIFKAITGSNFNEYVTALRLERAVELLREKKLSVQEISYHIGYQSTHHFIRLFKEAHGMTPKQYQKMISDEPESP